MNPIRLSVPTAHLAAILTFTCGPLAACGPHATAPATPPPAPTPTPPPVAEPTPPDAPPPATGFAYPQARRDDAVIDDYHGTKVADPYRWLENPDSEESRAWIDAENRVTFGFLDRIGVRSRLRQRLTQLMDYERHGVPTQKAGHYFYTRNDGLQNQAVVYVADSLDAEPRVLLDPNALSPDGTVALAGGSVSHDGKLWAYGLATAGSDWVEWRVRDIATGEDRPDLIKWTKWSDAAWTHDNKGFYYARYDEPKSALQDVNEYQKLYYHRLGAAQADDTLVYERKDKKEWGFGSVVTEDGRYLVIPVWNGTDPKNGLFYLDLKKKGARVVELINTFDASYGFAGSKGETFYLRTNLGASRGRVVAVDLRKPDRKHWKELIAENADTIDEGGVTVVSDRIIVSYTHDAHTQVKVFSLSGKHERDVELPGIGSASGFAGERADRETFYKFTGFTTPESVYRYEPATGKSTLFRAPKVAFKPGDYVTEQVFVTSNDGATKVPMFITHRKDLVPSADTPAMLYGYGGFNITLTPWFSPHVILWLEMGGVYALANIRGGNEYGEEWHLAGTKLRKQNVFDDFIASAEWLIANGMTSAGKLAINGGSNGGLLVAACMLQRPDLFGAVLSDVPVTDMLRYEKFTIGWAWVSDYGSASNADEFKALYAYSPLHNVAKGTAYPPTMITTADHDDRVVPGHSFKFAAALQAAQGGDAPILIRIETKAGHGGGKPTTKQIEEWADKLAFTAKVLRIELPPAD